jgi:dTDP-glucose 4,6-dehydratase
MRLRLTGAAGFIGSHLPERFLTAGYAVIGVDNFSTGRRVNLDGFRHHPQFTFIEQDVMQPITVGGDLDWILHFSSPASVPKYLEPPLETLRVNSEGTYQLLELVLRTTARFLLAGSAEIYGDPLIHPQVESYWGNVNPIGPRSIYDEGKRYAETITMGYHSKFSLSVWIIRIFNTYGPRMDPKDGRVATNFIMQALSGQALTIYGDGTQTQPFQYINHLVNGIVGLMGVECSSQVNFGNPEEFTMQLASLVKEFTGSDAPIVLCPLPVDDPKQRRPDISKTRELLKWSPTVSASKGLARTIQNFKTQAAVCSDGPRFTHAGSSELDEAA